MRIQRGGLQALRYTQIHRWQLRHPGGAAGEDTVLKPTGGERTDGQRGERTGSPHASFNRGISAERWGGKARSYLKVSLNIIPTLPEEPPHSPHPFKEINVLLHTSKLVRISCFLPHLSYCLNDKISMLSLAFKHLLVPQHKPASLLCWSKKPQSPPQVPARPYSPLPSVWTWTNHFVFLGSGLLLCHQRGEG